MLYVLLLLFLDVLETSFPFVTVVAASSGLDLLTLRLGFRVAFAMLPKCSHSSIKNAPIFFSRCYIVGTLREEASSNLS